MLPLQQHPRFARALRRLGRRAEALPLPGGGEAWALRRRVPLLGDLGCVLRGPVWGAQGAEERADALAALVRAGVRLVEADAPCPSLRRAGLCQVATAAHVAEIDLTREVAPHPKWRASLARAERAGLRVEDRPWDGGPHWLLDREAGQRRARGYRALPQALARAYAAEPGAARVLSAWEGAEPVAGMLLLLHPPAATYHLAWAGERGRAACAHHLLLSLAARRLAAEGFARLDLGGVDTEGLPGLARFKLGAGAAARALGGSWVALAPRRARR